MTSMGEESQRSDQSMNGESGDERNFESSKDFIEIQETAETTEIHSDGQKNYKGIEIKNLSASPRKFSERYGTLLSYDDIESEEKNIYDFEGYFYIIDRAKKSKAMQDFIEKMYIEKSRIDLEYSNQINKWVKKIECGFNKLKPFEHENELINMILTREMNVSKDIDARSQEIKRIGASFRRKTESMYGDSALGGLDNVNNLANKFKMAQKHWFKLLKEFHESRRIYIDQCVVHERLIEKRDVALEKNPNESDATNRKLKERLLQSSEEKKRLLAEYESLHKDIESERPQYIQDIQDIFQTYLNIEKSRFVFNREKELEYFAILRDFSERMNTQKFFNEALDCMKKIDPTIDFKNLTIQSGPSKALKIPVVIDIESKVHELFILNTYPINDNNSQDQNTNNNSTTVVSKTKMTSNSRKTNALKKQISEKIGKKFESTEVIPDVKLNFDIEDLL